MTAKQMPSVLARTAVLALLLAALFWNVLFKMVDEWFRLEEMGHGLFVPFVVGWVIWTQRDKLAQIPIRPSWTGWIVLLMAFTQLVVAELGAEYFLARTAFIVGLIGIILLTAGTAMLRALIFPLVLLCFMVRWPTILYNQITFPLQLLASQVAEIGLGIVGIPVLRDGNVLELPSQRLSVVEACSGIRSLLSLTFLSLIYGYAFDKRLWIRVTLFSSTIPIAIAANAFRVTITGVLSEYKREWSEGIYHSLEGWVIFMVALTALVVLHRTLDVISRRRHTATRPESA
ncbi:MAG TPA: exosortase/archaeosortase family protein [Armatimonadota bacterium]|jgi:exosortase